MHECPHCGFVNKPGITRCECCLSDIGDAAADAAAPPAAAPSAPAAAPSKPHATPPAAPAARTASSAGPSLPGALGASPIGPGSSPVSPTPVLGQPPPITAEVATGGAKLIIAIMIIGILGGIYLMRPQGGVRLSLARVIWMTAQASAQAEHAGAMDEHAEEASEEGEEPEGEKGEATASAETQPGGAAAGQPAPAGAASIPAASPASGAATAVPGSSAPPPAAPAGSSREEAARTHFDAAVKLLQGKQTAAARRALQDVMVRFPGTPAANDARQLLAQIPAMDIVPPTTTASAQPPPVTYRAPQRPAAAQQPELQPGDTITADDLRSGRAYSMARSRRGPAELPPSLQAGSTAARPSAPVTASARDSLQVGSVSKEGNGIAVEVTYVLASAHSRGVFAGAWMREEGRSTQMGYTAVRVQPGNGSVRVVLTNVPAHVTNLRLVLFEENGPIFLTRDFIIQR